MSEHELKNLLSQEGEARKEAMLVWLQDELGAVHHKRQQRNVIAKGAGLAAVIAISVSAWSLSRETSPENRVVEGGANSPMAQHSSVASVGNVVGVNDKYLVANPGGSVGFETVSDDEFLALLADAGQSAVLGEIDGKMRIIPDAPKRKL